MADLIKAFNEKLKFTEMKEGFEYVKTYEDGYADALKHKRLQCLWHPVGTELMKVTCDGIEILFKIAGTLSGKAVDGNDNVVATFDGVVEPAVFCANDDELEEIQLSPLNDTIYEFDSKSYIEAVIDGVSFPLEEVSIAKAVLDAKTIKKLVADASTEKVEEIPKKKTVKKKVEEPAVEEKTKATKTVDAPDAVVIEQGKDGKPVMDTFASGAVRGSNTVTKDGEVIMKGRCDLLPLQMCHLFSVCEVGGAPLEEIAAFQEDKDYMHLVKAARVFADDVFGDTETALLEYAVHMQAGCAKYGARNWEKGIPIYRYVDSGIRHYLKYKRGDSDERHDRAFLWNMLCGAWTCEKYPDLIDAE